MMNVEARATYTFILTHGKNINDISKLRYCDRSIFSTRYLITRHLVCFCHLGLNRKYSDKKIVLNTCT